MDEPTEAKSADTSGAEPSDDTSADSEAEAPAEKPDERREQVGDGTDRVVGAQRDGTPPLSELLRVVVIGIPVIVIAWFFLQWLHGR